MKSYESDHNITFWGKKAKYSGDFSWKYYGPHGYGTAIMEDGDIFKGHFSKGHPTSGTYTFSNGSYVHITFSYALFSHKSDYTVYFNEPAGYRKPRQQEKRVYDNGYYIGEMRNGKRHGIGTYKWDSGASYTGGWKEGEKHGVGRYVYDDGDVDIDMYLNGKLAGTIKREFKSVWDDTPSSDYGDYSPNTDSDNEEPSYKDKLYDDALDKYNRGDLEGAARDIHTIRGMGYDDDYVTDDGLNLKEFEDEINEELNNDD